MEVFKMNRRKILLINKKFQIRIIRQFFLLFFITFIIAIAVFFWQYLPFMTAVDALGFDSSHPFRTALEKFQFMLPVILICLTVCFICIFYITALIISNRIAGPIYHMEIFLENLTKQIKKNGLTDTTIENIKFREKDHFNELAGQLNNFLNTIKSSIS